MKVQHLVQNSHTLRVIQTQVILFLKSISERGGFRHRTTLNDLIFFFGFWVDLEIQFQSHWMSDPPFSDIEFKNKMDWVWTTLKLVQFAISIGTELNGEV